MKNTPAPPDATPMFCARVNVGRDDGGWQPIETAPRDGNPILAYWPGGGEWDAPAPGVLLTWFWDLGAGEFCAHGASGAQPTHWMPLPDPPASAKP